MNTLLQLESTIKNAWQTGNYTQTLPPGQIPTIPKNLQLTPWECMMLSRLDCVPGQVGKLILAFPPGGSPAELIPHVHGGGRVITVLAGTGIFRCKYDGKWVETVLNPSDQVMFPPNVFHTFVGKDGMALLVHALHAPYFAPTDPRAIEYADNTHTQEYPEWDPREYFPEILGVPQTASSPAIVDFPAAAKPSVLLTA